MHLIFNNNRDFNFDPNPRDYDFFHNQAALTGGAGRTTHLCELADGDEQQEGMGPRRGQLQRTLALLPHALLHLLAVPVPAGSLHHRHLAALGHALPPVADPG